MADNYGVLGQAAPGPGVMADVYTPPIGKVAHIRVVVANRAAVPDAFRVAVSTDGAALDASHYIAYDMPITENDSVISAPLVINASDILRVFSSLGDLTFTVTGLEEDA